MCEIKPCINPNCIDGWDTGAPAPVIFPLGKDAYLRSRPRLRCCTACNGRGYLADERENRRFYYEMRSVAANVGAGAGARDWEAEIVIGEPIEASTGLEAALRVLTAVA